MANIHKLKVIRCVLVALFCISWASQGLAFDKEEYCRSGMKAHQERAEWGSRLRSEMLLKCRGKDLQRCGQQYVNQINKQYEKDMFELVEMFNRENLSQAQRVGMRALVVGMQSAALEALKFEKSPNSIVLDMYSECLRVR